VQDCVFNKYTNIKIRKNGISILGGRIMEKAQKLCIPGIKQQVYLSLTITISSSHVFHSQKYQFLIKPSKCLHLVRESMAHYYVAFDCVR
jgi:hypothetical protein